jgi:hypothetical protein
LNFLYSQVILHENVLMAMAAVVAVAVVEVVR